MNYKDIQDALGTIARLSAELEDQYIESEGEVTPEAEALEAEKEAVTHLLQNDGIDALGRWLKLKEDEVKMWKAEKDAAARKQKSAQNTVEFIKAKVSEVMVMTGMEKAKGNYYGFASYVSEKTSVNMDGIEFDYLDEVTEAARNAGLPEFCDVAIVTNAARIKEYFEAQGVAPCYLTTTTADAVRFTKPRAGKE